MNDAEIQTEHEVAQPRWPWFAAGALLFTAAASAAVAVYLHWIPCRGSMLDETVFAPSGIRELSTACLQRMDTGLPFPGPPEVAEQTRWASELGAVAMVSAVGAWIVLIHGLGLGPRSRRTALIAAVIPVATAFWAFDATSNLQRDPDAYLSGWLWLAVEVVAVAMMIVFWHRHLPLRGGTFVGLAVVLWGTTAFGIFHQIGEFVAMTMFNQNNWDTPPGTGWITVSTLVCSGLGSVAIGALGPGRVDRAGEHVLSPIVLTPR